LNDEKKYTTVSIPTPLHDKIKKRIQNTGFNSVSSFVTYVLRQLESSIEEEKKTKTPFSKEDEEKIKERLRALGYID
jgi:Arc/MetJ-type ribon-helix-helix transcriptional regulator